jgi:hypothetical protein
MRTRTARPRAGLLLSLLLGLWPGAGRAEVSMTGWYFPLPFTLNSPNTPHRFGGIQYGMTFADAGVGLSFPLHSLITDAAQRFVVDLGLPLAVGVPDSGSSKFYAGNIRVGMYANWRFTMPFGDNLKVPAAWAVGGETNLPIAAIWGSNFAYQVNFPMFTHDPVAWVPKTWTIRPRAMLAMGQPYFYAQFDLALGAVVSFGSQVYFSPSWGFALGSNPHEMVSLSLELGGLHWVTPHRPGMSEAEKWKKDNVWTALGVRLYFGQFNMGVMGRIPLVRMFGAYESDFAFLLFFGYELRSSEPF